MGSLKFKVLSIRKLIVVYRFIDHEFCYQFLKVHVISNFEDVQHELYGSTGFLPLPETSSCELIQFLAH